MGKCLCRRPKVVEIARKDHVPSACGARHHHGVDDARTAHAAKSDARDLRELAIERFDAEVVHDSRDRTALAPPPLHDGRRGDCYDFAPTQGQRREAAHSEVLPLEGHERPRVEGQAGHSRSRAANSSPVRGGSPA